MCAQSILKQRENVAGCNAEILKIYIAKDLFSRLQKASRTEREAGKMQRKQMSLSPNCAKVHRKHLPHKAD